MAVNLIYKCVKALEEVHAQIAQCQPCLDNIHDFQQWFEAETAKQTLALAQLHKLVQVYWYNIGP